MNKKDLITVLAKELGTTKVAVEAEVLPALKRVFGHIVAEGGITLNGVGKITVTESKGRKGEMTQVDENGNVIGKIPYDHSDVVRTKVKATFNEDFVKEATAEVEA